MCRNRSFNGAVGGFDAHRSDCADGGAIDPILEIRPPAGMKTSVRGDVGGGFVELALRPGRNQGKVVVVCFQLDMESGNQEPHWEPLKECPIHRPLSVRGRKLCVQGGCGGGW